MARRRTAPARTSLSVYRTHQNKIDGLLKEFRAALIHHEPETVEWAHAEAIASASALLAKAVALLEEGTRA